MTVTKSDFKGEERGWTPDGGDGTGGSSTEGLLKQLSAEQNDPAAQGGNAEPGAVGDGSGSPRRHGAAQAVPAGNDASTGAAGVGLPIVGAPGQKNSLKTGAGSGSPTVKKYG